MGSKKRVSPASSPEDIKTFKDLFWKARASHRKKRKSAKATDQDHKSALKFAKERKWSWGNELLAGLLLAYQDDTQNALDSLSTLELPELLVGELQFTIGVAHHGLKDWSSAVECYQQALDSPIFDRPGNAWHNMGIAYSEKKEFDSAFEYFRKALDSPGHEVTQMTSLNLALALHYDGKHSEAKEQVTQVLEQADNEHKHSRAKIILSTIDAAERGFEPDPEDTALTTPSPPSLEDGPEGRMKEALMNRKTRYEEYLGSNHKPAPDGLSILRGWSSSVTLLEGAQDCQWSGGGYFLKWRGKGLIIDPGFDFLDNFHQAGLHATDIHAVVVSHNHPDHNADLSTLDNLCYEIARVAEPTPKFLFAMDEDTAALFEDNSPKHRGSPHKFSRSDYERERWLEEDGLPFVIEHFPVEHGKDVPHAMGLRIRLLDEDGTTALTIGYTGDGEYSANLSKQLQDVDLLIAHVSQPDTKEFNEPEHLKKLHLGYNGAIRLVKEVQPNLTLIGEFWAGLADLRLDLITGIRLRSGNNAVFPACLGLHLSVPELHIRCTRCKEKIPPSKVRIAPPLKEFGMLGYLCDTCII